ncbi:MAG: site-specific DNA-methyltransferase [Gammaproteobacteria bacterium]
MMKDEERKSIIEILKSGGMLSSDWAPVLFPNQKRECELVYDGKAREEDILAETMSLPLQRARLFGNNGEGWHNQLIFGDNLQAMQALLAKKKSGALCNADGTPGIRLVYIDPPFSTKREMQGTGGEQAYRDKLAAGEFLEFLRKRLIFIRELLSDDGSVYVHLDWRMNSYVRVLMDEVFGKSKFKNQIIWSYRRWPAKTRKYQSMHETILFYADKERCVWNQPMEKKAPGTPSYKRWNVVNSDGSLTTHSDRSEASTETNMRDVWELSWLQSNSVERVDYPTQKPEALLARIIAASSNEGDIVADFFLGSGTTAAVAEKLGRRWVGSDCGKLAIYTTQKRMLNLQKEIGNKGARLKAKPFALINVGHYDLELLHEKQRAEWRQFALALFECRDAPHKIGGIQMDGYRRDKSVMVFDQHKHRSARITEETIAEIATSIKGKAGRQVFIIAPAQSFAFFQDYIDAGDTRYFALRIPYSIIRELHKRDFSALRQPVNKDMANEIITSVGFDFIRTPQLKCEHGITARKGETAKSAFFKITEFNSKSMRTPSPAPENRETLAMLMLDLDYNGKYFQLGRVFLADEIRKENWTAWFPQSEISGDVMAIFVDVYGNEARVLIPAAEFGAHAQPAKNKTAHKKNAQKRK